MKNVILQKPIEVHVVQYSNHDFESAGLFQLHAIQTFLLPTLFEYDNDDESYVSFRLQLRRRSPPLVVYSAWSGRFIYGMFIRTCNVIKSK